MHVNKNVFHLNLTQTIWIYFQENEIDKVYLEISRVVTSQLEATTFGIHLGIKRHDVTYYVTNRDVRDAAYRFLCWTKDNYCAVEMWEKIIEALKTLEKNCCGTSTHRKSGSG